MPRRARQLDAAQAGAGVAGSPATPSRVAAPAPAEALVATPGATPSASSPNGGWSLTAPVWFTGNQTAEFLACGVDSLDLGLYVDWKCDLGRLHQHLDAAKKSASGTAGIAFGTDGACLMLPAGKQRFPWHLQYPEFHLFISRRETYFGETPNAFVSLNSKTLWTHWLKGSLDLVKNRLHRLGGYVARSKPSRCDLAADYFIRSGLQADDLLPRRVPRHLKHHPYFDGDRLETWYVGGTSSPVRLRIYDKGREIQHEGTKYWFKDVWERDSVDDVWRVEFQVRRDVLRRYRMHSLPDLERNLCGLWEYLTSDWFTLREVDNEHTTRRTISPWWGHVQSLGPKFGDRQPLQRFDNATTADVRWYASHVGGCLKTLAALRRKSTLNDALSDLEVLLRAKLDPATFAEEVRIRSIQLGIGTSETEEDSGCRVFNASTT